MYWARSAKARREASVYRCNHGTLGLRCTSGSPPKPLASMILRICSIVSVPDEGGGKPQTL